VEYDQGKTKDKSSFCFRAFEAWTSEGGLAPVYFEIFSKKGCFLSFEWEKTNFTGFPP